MRQKKWKEKIGGNSELIIIGALIILSIILAADHLFNLPRLLSGAPPEQFEWGELVFDLVAIFCIGLISFILVRKSEAERREVEQIRWREKDKAQEYLDVAGVILLAINAEQKVTLINRKGCEILGYEEEEITGKNWFDQFVPEWDRERVRAAFVRLMPGGHKAAEYFENPVLTKSGEERIIAWHNTLLTDETGNITGTLSSGEDITERKKTEEALQEERNKLQAIIDSMEYGLTIQDRDYNIIFQNEALKGLFGNQLGEKCYQAYEFRDEICDGCPVRMAWADGKPHTAERKIMWKSGEIMFWENTANPIRDTRGEIVACLEIARNITERKKAEETLRESQAKLQSIFSAVPAGIGMTTNQTIRELNARLCEITGYSKEELLGKSISVVYPSDQDYLSARCEIYDQLREKGYSTIEASWKRKDGKLISVLLNCALLKPGDFSQGITFTVLDISERKKAEKTLGQSEERYRELFDNMGSGVAVYEAIDKGKDFMFKGFNRAGEQIEKVEKESLIGKTILEIFSDAENFPLLKVFERVWRTGKPERASTEVRKDQIIVGWRENYIYRLPTGEMVSIFEDITERKRVEEALRESEEKYKALIEAAGRAGEGIIIIQDNGVEEAAFVFVNEQFCRMSGYSQEELLGRSSWDFIPHEIAVRLRDWYKRRHMGESLPSHYEAAGVHKDGTIVPLELSIVTMPWQGKIATVLYIRDITERKKAEETIRTERDKLENVTRNIGVGLATISKDYQTIWANEVLKQIFGEVEGKLCYNTYNGRTNICPGCGVREVFEQGKDVSVHEQVGKDKDGNTIWSQIIATPLRDKEGNITASMEVVVPITERKKAEERLKAEKEFSEKLISTTNAIIVGLDKEHRILLFNQGAERITGYKVKEIIGKDWFKIFFKEEMYPEMIRVWKDAWGKDSHVHTNLICSKSGKEIIAQWSNTSIMDGAGEPIMLLCIAVDITERKKAEEALRESEEKHRTYIENAPYGIFIVDSEARYIDVNEAACRMTGYSRDELLNMTIMQLAPSDTSPELLEPFEKLKRHGKTSSEIVIQRKDASVIHASLDAVALSDGRFIAFCSDITRRKKAEEEIENLAKFPSENPDPILRISKDGIILYTNDSSLSLLDEWGTFVNQNAPDYLKQSVTEIFNTGLTKNIEIEHQGRILSFIVVPVHGTDYVNFYGRDITQSKKAEEALRTSEEKYRAIVENATDQIFTLDRQCRFLAINKTAAEISRKSVSEMVGKSLLLIFPKETAAQFSKNIEEVFETGQSKFIEERMYVRGKEFYNSTTLNPIKDDKRNVIAVTGIVRDITERKKAEEELRKSEEKYRALLETTDTGFCILDSQGIIMDANSEYVRLAGHSTLAEIMGRNVIEWTAEHDLEKNAEEVKKCRQQGFVRNLEIDYVDKHGKTTPVEIDASVIQTDKGQRILTLCRDITEKKRLQEQLIQSEKLAAVGTLAYGIAHEFNNILAGMMANAELGLISKEHEQIKECFEIIVDNSHRASSITNNLLAFARHKDARKELVDITEPLKSVLAITHRELEKNNIEIIEKFKPVPKIYCDPGQFSEVFLNMITNARDAMHPKGGTLTIQVESAGDCIRIIFKDTGCGIPEEIKGKIFEPFVTTKGALGRSEVPGTGLGLFLTYGIINGYKGKIEVETKVGKGTKFSIIIPISENQPPELLLDTRIESSKETEKKLKILLVDDEKAITHGLKKFLESKGHKVSTSLRAKEGLEIFRKGRFDLVLSDITIPDMDGIELIKKVKEKDPQAKIIVITGHLQKEKEEKARQAGADEVLIKPFRNELLYQTISKVVN